MANFDVQILDLVDLSYSDQTAMDQWMADGVKEIINMMPATLKSKCATVTPLSNSPTTMDMDGVGEILYVTRENSDSGRQVPCRGIPAAYGALSEDIDNMIYYATNNDPVYWVESNGSDASTLVVKPTPTANQTANVYHISYPPNSTSWSAGGSTLPTVSTSIANFPDELEYLVPLRAAITALEYQAAIEEDPELYLPLLQNLKQDYTQGLQLSGAMQAPPQQAGR